jgi:hypothetical protein
LSWIATIYIVGAVAYGHPLVCCEAGHSGQLWHRGGFEDLAACQAMAREWALGKTLTTGVLYDGACEQPTTGGN